jgi:hypothetical protein
MLYQGKSLILLGKTLNHGSLARFWYKTLYPGRVCKLRAKSCKWLKSLRKYDFLPFLAFVAHILQYQWSIHAMMEKPKTEKENDHGEGQE